MAFLSENGGKRHHFSRKTTVKVQVKCIRRMMIVHKKLHFFLSHVWRPQDKSMNLVLGRNNLQT